MVKHVLKFVADLQLFCQVLTLDRKLPLHAVVRVFPVLCDS